jgi:UDP-N-acetyl-D-mannosaminuronic acid dehydrogenase
VKNLKISIIGLGYIGLPTACLLASKGYEVIGVDINETSISQINNGIAPIQEPHLEEFLVNALKNNKFRATKDIEASDIFIICVPTPFIRDNEFPKPDLSYIFNAVDSLIPILENNNSIILESTSPVGTTEDIAKYISKKNPALRNLKIGYCPERVLPGNIFQELVLNDRVVGGVDKLSTKRLVDFYNTFVEGEVIATDSKTAEMCKLSENSFRDTNIAFANELSILCDEKSIDIWELISLANRHPRVNILQPGPGVGGHCIAVDPWFLVDGSSESAILIKSARNVNDSKPFWVTNKISNAIELATIQINREPVVGCFGLTFKPNIDDIRESPAMIIFNLLKARGFNVKAIDPNIANAEMTADLISLENAFKKIDIFVILVKHSQFLDPIFTEQLRTKNYLDFCGLLNS